MISSKSKCGLYEMNDEEFQLYLEYHMATCERMDLIGATNHSLDILQKGESI